MTEPYSKILRACALSHLQGLVKDSRQHPYLPLTLQAPLDLLGHIAQGIEQLVQQCGSPAELFLVLGSTQN